MLSELIKLLDERAVDAGFRSPEGGKLIFTDDPHWLEAPLTNQVKYWSTKFASVLLVTINATTFQQAWRETRHAEAFLDAALLRLEKNGSVVDGYLVLALTLVNDELKNFINDVEKDTRFVRKHVVYQNAKGWQRCQRITPLGLIRPTVRVEHAGFVPENEKMADILAALGGLKGKELARNHGRKWDLNE